MFFFNQLIFINKDKNINIFDLSFLKKFNFL